MLSLHLVVIYVLHYKISASHDLQVTTSKSILLKREKRLDYLSPGRYYIFYFEYEYIKKIKIEIKVNYNKFSCPNINSKFDEL